MITEIPKQPDRGGDKIASIDIGSHTVRMLVAERQFSPELYKPLLRKRGYSRLADGFRKNDERRLQPEAIDRTLLLLDDCSLTLQEYGVVHPQAVSTGVVRDAVNKDDFIQRIYHQTGIRVRVISGEHEALLTKLGVWHSLDMMEGASIIFDLGGGTTEFIFTKAEETLIRSLPIGAMVFTQQFLNSGTPHAEKIDHLFTHTQEVLEEAFPERYEIQEGFTLIGSGGTVTTLAAMINQMEVSDITPAKLNGLKITREQIQDLFSSMRVLSHEDRLHLPGLDEGRAEVILAGTLAVIQIMHFFRSFHLTVSYSDMLEGALIHYLQGEKYE
ncbi:MAG: hypothetical protein JW932_20130 [Deltaproteobacteria bacterium]|nr:hypothetical protein [Deltaproteobacteria bacterium]